MMWLVLFLTFSLAFVSVTSVAERDWWENEVFYQIYPRSFMDSDGDGVGDLQGIKQKLNHFKEAGIDAVWLSPIFKSPMVDFGYDISDFRSIHEEFGTINDFDELSVQAKKCGIKLILDFVPNHTSDKHVWFQLSANRTAGYEDYYIWNDGKVVNGTRQPPNNWIGNFGISTWTYHEGRGQWYYHQFAVQQPDLNYRNSRVVQEMKDILSYWLEKGVAGFRIDAVPYLFEDIELRDEPRSYDPTAEENDFAYYSHIYTKDLPDGYDMIYQWRDLLDKYAREHDNVTRVMMTEAYADIQDQMKYYGNETTEGAHFTFNFLLITDLNINSTARDFVFTINKWLSYLPHNKIPNWVIGNHDNPRVGTRFGTSRIDGLNMLIMILPGVGVTYYGEEIGMVNAYISWEDTKDPQGINAGRERYQLFSRDGERTPFQWNSSKNAGFSNASKTWLNVATDYKQVNLKKQKQSAKSHFKVYQNLMKLRKTNTLIYGDVEIKALSDSVLVVIRKLTNEDTYVYVFNIGYKTEVVNLFDDQSYDTEVVISSVNATFQKGSKLNTTQFKIKSSEAYILKMAPICTYNNYQWYYVPLFYKR